MARKAIPIGPNILALVEDARIDLACAALALQEGENEPEFNLSEEIPNSSDEELVNKFRQGVEPPRVCRRLQLLRKWSRYEQNNKQVFS